MTKQPKDKASAKQSKQEPQDPIVPEVQGCEFLTEDSDHLPCHILGTPLGTRIESRIV
ncbi:hypothetical protein cce_5255 (plasmid) [Crocosphaera subtropica ATCC 51142]|uniref:Uncharacterized protein n=1 Tax=Crocosphaera subtropica (strain ATCC 51142 / BH68) TaxID=43989 RepID=B1X390_CROS5|nr:hypothetical protein [Crocosphaera subtropica]ACB54601.1 hypothetical protein cce_5255 [Crocosphaera subtropica ATCC 51142]